MTTLKTWISFNVEEWVWKKQVDLFTWSNPPFLIFDINTIAFIDNAGIYRWRIMKWGTHICQFESLKLHIRQSLSKNYNHDYPLKIIKKIDCPEMTISQEWPSPHINFQKYCLSKSPTLTQLIHHLHCLYDGLTCSISQANKGQIKCVQKFSSSNLS